MRLLVALVEEGQVRSSVESQCTFPAGVMAVLEQLICRIVSLSLLALNRQLHAATVQDTFTSLAPNFQHLGGRHQASNKVTDRGSLVGHLYTVDPAKARSAVAEESLLDDADGSERDVDVALSDYQRLAAASE